MVRSETIPAGQARSSELSEWQSHLPAAARPAADPVSTSTGLLGGSNEQGEPDKGPSVLQTLIALSPVLLILLSVTVLAGWLLANETLITVLPGHAPMKPNTALGFLAAGLGLAALRSPSSRIRRMALFLGLLTLACGALTLLEHMFNVNLHIDQALFTDPFEHVHPGRMTSASALNFSLAGLSLLLLLWGRSRATLAAQCCAILIAAGSFAAFVSSLYASSPLYDSVDDSTMAVHTGLGFLILGAGLLMVRRDAGLARVLSAPQFGGWLARRLLPAVLVLPLIPGWMYLHPAISLGRPRLAMTLFAVAFAALGIATLCALAVYLNGEELQRLELIHARERSALAAQQSERELRLVTDHLPTLLSYIDVQGRFLRVNRTYERWMGLTSAEIVGRSVEDLLGNEYWKGTEAAREAVLRGETVTFEIAYPTVRGVRQAEVTYAPDKDETNQVRGIACMVLDVHEKHRAELALVQSAQLESANRQLHQLAITDQLTGLRNRRAFEEYLAAQCLAATQKANGSAAAMAVESAASLAVLMIDIDNFKLHNDTWGHAAGDDVLRKLGAILSSTIDAPNLSARYGGEEFTILLSDADLTHAQRVAERLQRVVAEHQWSETPVTLSIGISCSATVGPHPNQLVRSADQALYLAKRTGKNRICSATSLTSA